VELLRDLTLAYGAVLAATVGGGLVMSVVFLRRISSALAEARTAMGEIVKATEPLAGHLEGLRDGSAEWAEQLGAARPRLARVDRMDSGPADSSSETGRSIHRLPRRWKWVSRLFGG
jgi:hypothetical protein